MDFGIASIWALLQDGRKLLSLRKRPGEKEKFRLAVVLKSINMVLIIGSKHPGNNIILYAIYTVSD